MVTTATGSRETATQAESVLDIASSRRRGGRGPRGGNGKGPNGGGAGGPRGGGGGGRGLSPPTHPPRPARRPDPVTMMFTAPPGPPHLPFRVSPTAGAGRRQEA